MKQLFECIIKRHAAQPDGSVKFQSEKIAVEAVNFTDAETKVSTHFDEPVDVAAIKRSKINEVFLASDGVKFFDVKVAITVLDEGKGKEKIRRIKCLVRADDIDEAGINSKLLIEGSLYDGEIESIAESKIVYYIPDAELR